MKKNILIILLFATVLYSQTDKPLILSIDDAVKLAYEKNAELKIALLEVNKTEQKKKEALSGLFPKLDVTGQYQRYIDKPVIFLPEGSPLGTTLKIGSDNSYSASASLSIPIFSLGLYESIGMVNESYKISLKNVQIVKNKITLDVKKAFLTVLLLRESKDVINQSLKNAEETFANIQRLNLGGTMSDYDALRAEVQVENLKPVVLQTENNYELSLEALKVAIGLNANQEIDIVGELQYDELFKYPSESEIMEELISDNPQLAILENQVRLTERNIDLEKSAHYPTLAGFGSYQYQAQANDFKFSDYRWVNTFILGFQIQIPVFSGFKIESRINQAEISLNQVEEQKRNFSEAIKTQALSILYRIKQAVKRIEGQNKTVKQATEGYEIAKRRFENNLAIQLEVNDAELALRQSKVNRLQAIYDLKVAEAELENILGKIK